MFQLVMYEDGGPHAGTLAGDAVHPVPEAPAGADALVRVVADWDRWRPVFEAAARPGTGRPLSGTRLLAPLMYPGKILAAGANYSDHAQEMAARGGGHGQAEPSHPYLFMKPGRHCVIATGDPVRAPAWAGKLDWEVELCVVIGRQARAVARERALDVVFGYTVMNDISSRELIPRADGPFKQDWLSGKGLDTFGPMGPGVTPREFVPDVGHLKLHCRVNGQVMQDSTTANLIFDVPALVAYASERCTLDPGDVIMTGTPSGVGAGRGVFLQPGDLVESEVEGLGRIANRIERLA